MPLTIEGTTYRFAQGETLPLQYTVMNNGLPVSSITVAKIALRQAGVQLLYADCTIVDNVVSYKITQAASLLLSGNIQYEIRIKSALDEVDSLVIGLLEVYPGVITQAL